MATLVFSAAGTALAGPLGGAIGSLVGRQVDTALFGTARKGARLSELDATSSTYGQVLPRHYGAMRVAGTIIWATELIEHSETQGTGKGSPSLTTFSYSANFAVALSSRPLAAIGRIWADGKLLRGEDGELKVGGQLRLHTGRGDQATDPLLVAAEGPDACPAYRGLAYVVFENLDLSDFYNHIPALTFEVFADNEAFTLQDILDDALDDCDAGVGLAGISGFTCNGSVLECMEALDTLVPLDVDVAEDALVISRERFQEKAIPLAEAAIPLDGEGFGARSGHARRRAAPAQNPLALLRYYDRERDYLPSVQRALGRPAPGEPYGVELPAALDAQTAATLIRQARYRSDWSRETLSWRTGELDPDVAPGSLVTVPGQSGHWRVREWEWCDAGVEIELERVMPASTQDVPVSSGTPGRINPPQDGQPGETTLVAFEMPLDSANGLIDSPRPCLAVSSTSANWTGAALYADQGDGAMRPLGPSGRARAIVGRTDEALPDASPHLVDRSSQLALSLIDPAMQLASASSEALANGANLALVGEELIQFARAEARGDGKWLLSGLLRGRAGTEASVFAHSADEPFVLLDARVRPLDPAILGTAEERQVLALGRGDPDAVRAPIRLDGLTRRPLPPVHPRRVEGSDGTLLLTWARRARGAWKWPDSLEVPLVEETERYLVTLGDPERPVASWTTAIPALELDSSTLASLAARDPSALFNVRQAGTHGLSPALALGGLPNV